MFILDKSTNKANIFVRKYIYDTMAYKCLCIKKEYLRAMVSMDKQEALTLIKTAHLWFWYH